MKQVYSLYNPIHTSDSNVIRPQFESDNCDKSASFTLQGGRGSSTTVFFVFVYMIQKSSEYNQRCSKIVEADVIRQKFQMQFELLNPN